MASTLKIDTVTTPDGSGNIAFSRPITGDGSNLTGILPAVGASGNVLTSDGTNWASQAAAGGGAWTKITSTVASDSSSSIEFISGIDSTYATYVVVASDIHLATANQGINFQVSTDAGSSWDTSAKYTYHVTKLMTDNAAYSCAVSGTNRSSWMELMRWFGIAAGHCGSLALWFTNPSSTISYKGMRWHSESIVHSSTHAMGHNGHGFYENLTAVNGFKFYTNSGNIVSGRFTLYGIAHA